jgi:hypothetical protein
MTILFCIGTFLRIIIRPSSYFGHMFRHLELYWRILLQKYTYPNQFIYRMRGKNTSDPNVLYRYIYTYYIMIIFVFWAHVPPPRIVLADSTTKVHTPKSVYLYNAGKKYK